MQDQLADKILAITAEIVIAHVSNNEMESHALPSLIQSVYEAISGVKKPEAVVDAEPAVPIKKSVFPDYIICLEDGKKLRTIKRHLQVSHGMNPDGYRAKWGLPRDYPMVAPKYAAFRAGLAKQTGLGRKPAETQELPALKEVTARRARSPKV